LSTETVLPASVSPTVAEVLVQLARDPWRSLILKWNWKSAVFSSLIRAHIFFFVTLRAGWRAAVGAFFAELAYRGITSGFYGSLTQAFRSAEPAWAAALAVMLLLPLSSHALEFVVHSLRHTPHLVANIVTSMCFTTISTLFNWYAMRKGSLIVGREGQSVARDMRSMPRLIGGFLAAGPLALWNGLRVWLRPPLNECENAASD
jgi:hypothetical protein